MRPALAVLAILTLPAVALAQQRATPGPSSGLAPLGLPLPAIGLPLPTIGLPLAPLGVPGPPATVSPPLAFDGQGEPPRSVGHGQSDNQRHHVLQPFGGHALVFFGSPYYWPQDSTAQATAQAAAPATAPDAPLITGVLRLEIEPNESLQFFVDGVFVGTAEDTSGELALDPGTHRIEIRKPGYEVLTFDARIVAGRSITYRDTLTPLPEAVVPPPEDAKPKPKPPQTFYLIPGCYMGNIPPEQVPLPPGCDRRRVITYTP